MKTDTNEDTKLQNLIDYFKKLGSAAIAFSGGVDSTFLVKAAHIALGNKMQGVTLVSKSFSPDERKAAQDFCKINDIPQVEITYNELDIPGFAENPKNRCYICKIYLFTKLKEIAEKNNLKYVCEGSNLDDTGDYRPGLQAIKELEIKSPLIDVQLTKQEIRNLSKKLKLPTWNKPSFPCLATRFPYGETISQEKLQQVNEAENYLRTLGFTQIRVRHHNKIARIELLPDEIQKLLTPQNTKKIVEKFKTIGFTYITLDLQGFRSGSLNEVIQEHN